MTAPTLTVAGLIEKLQALPPEMEVWALSYPMEEPFAMSETATLDVSHVSGDGKSLDDPAPGSKEVLWL